MMRTKFVSGLRSELRDISRHRFDTIKSFDQLRIEMRKIEAEVKGLQNPSKDPDVKPKPQAKAMDAELKPECCKLQRTMYILVDKFD